MSIAPNYNEDYRRKVFDAWVLAGRCSMPKLITVIPANEQGNKPDQHTILKWMESEGWVEHADAIQASALQIADDRLIMTKAEMLRTQFQDAVAIAQKARDAMIDRGFDTSAAAVTAYFKAVDEQRRVAGIAEFMEKVGVMTDEQIEAEIAERLARQKDMLVGEVEEAENKAETGEA